jgi:hypothetical protein
MQENIVSSCFIEQILMFEKFKNYAYQSIIQHVKPNYLKIEDIFNNETS